MLRLALDKYNQLIKKYPTSDKIDDAAFRAGGIYEYFKDYTIALLYYQRAYQWDPDTIHPARFKAAYILDKRLHRRAEALELYQQVAKKKGQHGKYKVFAENRIRELTKSDEGIE
jgi:tetratricopeptide (TPR) repeat protein